MFRGKRLTVVLVLTMCFCLILPAVASASPGYVVGGYRFLSSEVATNPTLMQELNGLLGDNYSTLIVDLDGNPFNYSAFIAAGGVNFPGGFQAFASVNVAAIPAGTLIKHYDGTTESDPTASTPSDFYVLTIE